MRRCLIWAVWLSLAFGSSSAAQSSARRVLILYSFESGYATDRALTEVVRAELNRRWPVPIDFFEISLQPAPSSEVFEEEPVLNYLRSALAGHDLDLVVTTSGPAAVFVRKHHDELFPTTPVLLSSLDRRWVEDKVLRDRETVVAISIEPGRVVEDVLEVLPTTSTIAVVLGSSPLEKFWRNEMSRTFQRFEDKIRFVWLSDLSFGEMLDRTAELPANSAILCFVYSVDARGVAHAEPRVLAALHGVANAPMFGLFSTQMGLGIVGGRLISVEEAGRQSASVAMRILRGEAPASIRTPVQEHGPPTYDWRELRRWGISEATLPAGSVVLFRQPTVWEHYKVYIFGVTLVVGLQALLITGLVMQRIRRRRIEYALRESEGRFRRVADGAPVMLWTAGPDSTVDFVNSTVLEFTGLSMEQALGDGWLGRVHPDDVAQCLRTYLPAIEARQPFRVEFRFRRADGSYRWLLDTGVPRFGPDGSLAGYIGSALDITERKDMEQALLDNRDELTRANQQNQDLAGRLINAQEAERQRIARDLHDDVSQQLAGLGIMVGSLKHRLGGPGSPPDVDRTLTTLQDRISELAQAVRNLSHELHPSVLEHAGLVATLQRHCADVAQTHHVEVNFHAADEVDAVGRDVALCLFRVAQEALANAVRHARARSILVQLTVTDESIELRVADDGTGFVVSNRARGGLGLRSIDERVRLVGGRVRLDSQVGQGTNLMVRIPLSAAMSGLVRQP